jgi:hypothetical protein
MYDGFCQEFFKSLFKISCLPAQAGAAILLCLWARFLRQNLAKQPVCLRFVASNRAPML